MVLVAGSKLIDDFRRAPDDVLSHHEPVFEVREHALAKQTSDTHKHFLVSSTRIYARHFELERRVPFRCNTF